MASKLLMQATYLLRTSTVTILKAKPKLMDIRKTLPQLVLVRRVGLIPRTQYDAKEFPNKFKLGYVLGVYWEIIPLLVTVCVSMTILVFSVAWAACHKVDVVYSTHNRDNLSRTMNLRNDPPVHKLITINQVYEAWPEMQDSLDHMKKALLEESRRKKNVCIGPERMPPDSIKEAKKDEQKRKSKL